jgi:hypothetical protein
MYAARRLRNAISTLSILTVPLVVSAPAHAASPAYSEAPAVIVNYHSGKCLDVVDRSTQSGARVQQWRCFGHKVLGMWVGAHTNQEWTFKVWGEDSQQDPNPAGQLVNVNSGKCLDDTNRSRSNGTVMQQWRCLYQRDGQPQTNQTWVLVTAPVSGALDFEFMNQLSRRALEINGNESTPADASLQSSGDVVDQWNFWGGYNQIWYPLTVA